LLDEDRTKLKLTLWSWSFY